jgi:hypothetical protein
MGHYNFKLTNSETGSITEITGASIKQILHTISAFRKQENKEPVQYMKSGKRIKEVKGLHSKESESVFTEIQEEILKG